MTLIRTPKTPRPATNGAAVAPSADGLRRWAIAGMLAEIGQHGEQIVRLRALIAATEADLDGAKAPRGYPVTPTSGATMQALADETTKVGLGAVAGATLTTKEASERLGISDATRWLSRKGQEPRRGEARPRQPADDADARLRRGAPRADGRRRSADAVRTAEEGGDGMKDERLPPMKVRPVFVQYVARRRCRRNPSNGPVHGPRSGPPAGPPPPDARARGRRRTALARGRAEGRLVREPRPEADRRLGSWCLWPIPPPRLLQAARGGGLR